MNTPSPDLTLSVHPHDGRDLTPSLTVRSCRYPAFSIEDARALLATGMTINAVAGALGVSHGRVTRNLRGLVTPSQVTRNGWRRRRARLNGSFWERVDRSGGPDACWPWLGHRTSQGYGQFLRNWRSVQAHREALVQAIGRPLQPGMFACHHCDNRICCNPAHLYEGTAADNNRDMLERGRRRSGVSLRRLSPTDRADMLALALTPGMTNAQVAARYGVCTATVYRAKRGARRAAA